MAGLIVLAIIEADRPALVTKISALIFHTTDSRDEFYELTFVISAGPVAWQLVNCRIEMMTSRVAASGVVVCQHRSSLLVISDLLVARQWTGHTVNVTNWRPARLSVLRRGNYHLR